MVFYRFAAGLTFGTVVAYSAPQPIYMLIASSFVRPHLAYRI